MLTTQQLYDIASRHDTAMADAMVEACRERAEEAGEALSERPRGRARRRGRRPSTDPDRGEWLRMVEGNSDIRHTHV